MTVRLDVEVFNESLALEMPARFSFINTQPASPAAAASPVGIYGI